MNLFGRNEVAPNLGRRGRNSLAVVDAGPYKLHLFLTASPAVTPPTAMEELHEAEPSSGFEAASRTNVDPFAQPPPDWRPSLAPSPLLGATSSWVEAPPSPIQEEAATTPPLKAAALPEPAVEDVPADDEAPSDAPVAAKGDTDSDVVIRGLSENLATDGVTPQPTTRSEDPATQQPTQLAGPSFAVNGSAAVADDRALEPPVRVIKLDPQRDISMVVRPALSPIADTDDAARGGADNPLPERDDTTAPAPFVISGAPMTVVDWPWRGDDEIAPNVWRGQLSLLPEADDAACIRVLSTFAPGEIAQPHRAAALRAGYAGADSPALRLSLLATLCAAPSSPLEFWWCVAGGALYPEERIVAYRALANSGDTRGYAHALVDPQASAAVALGRQLLRDRGEQAFDQALSALEPDRAGLLRAELTGA